MENMKVRIHKFLEKTKRKNLMNRNSGEEIQPAVKEQDNKLRKKVNVLMKKQKLQQVRKIVKHYDDSKPWGQEIQVKIGCRSIQILMKTAYIQPLNDQVEGGPPDIRPAFVHKLKL